MTVDQQDWLWTVTSVPQMMGKHAPIHYRGPQPTRPGGRLTWGKPTA